MACFLEVDDVIKRDGYTDHNDDELLEQKIDYIIILCYPQTGKRKNGVNKEKLQRIMSLQQLFILERELRLDILFLKNTCYEWFFRMK